MSAELPPPPFGANWSSWGERINEFLVRTRDKLSVLTSDARASQDGIMLWDRANLCPVVSKSGVFTPIGYGHGDHCVAYTTTSFTAASANTAYAITWSNEINSHHISVDGTNTSRVVFAHAGIYKVDFSCELQSSNASAKTVYLFPAINGVDQSYNTIVHTMSGTASQVVSRSVIFEVSAGDYIEAKYAVTDTNLVISGTAATAFSPVAPSATIMISEVAAA